MLQSNTGNCNIRRKQFVIFKLMKTRHEMREPLQNHCKVKASSVKGIPEFQRVSVVDLLSIKQNVIYYTYYTCGVRCCSPMQTIQNTMS